MKHLRITDPEIARAILLETRRQGEKLELIASENFASEAVFEAQDSVLMNKYAEGYPGRRYYGGCEHVDIAERLAIERAKLLFDADHANVQPHSGTQANMQAYFSLLEPGDTILGLNLTHGGHLSHGHPVNFSGRYFKTAFYGVERETGTIDYDQVRAAALAARPKLIVAGASAYPRILDFARFAAVAEEVGALLLADIAHIAGLVAAGSAPFPRPARGGRDEHHAQDPARTARRAHPLPRVPTPRPSTKTSFPGFQGGPLMHVIAAKAVAFHEALQPEFKAYQAQVLANARVLAAELSGHGLRLVSGGTDNHLMLVDLGPLGITGREAETWLDDGGDHREQELDPLRPAAAGGDQRHPDRHPRADHAGHARGGDADDCAADLSHPRRARRGRDRPGSPGRRRRPHRRLSPVRRTAHRR